MLTSPRLAAVLLLLSAAAPAQVLPARAWPATEGSQSLAAGDLDGDGATDLVTGGKQLGVLLRAPEGGFLPPTVYAAKGDDAREVALGQLDTDGDLDVVHSEGVFSSASSLTVRLGDGQGQLGAAFNLTLGSDADDLALGDMDGDGDDDVAFVTQSQDRLTVVPSDGAGGLLPPVAPLTTGDGPAAVVIGELNGDGDLDLVTANTLGNSLTRFLGHGPLGFSPLPPLAAQSPTALLLGDVDEDGDADLLASGSTIVAFLGSGDGSFAPGQSVGSEGSLVALTDMDGNGFDDLVITNDGCVVLPGGPGPGFGTGAPGVPVTLAAFGLAVLDVDADGLQDVAAVDFFGHHVAEVHGTGFGGLQSFTSFPLTPVKPSAFVLRDLDGDTDIDVACSMLDSGVTSGGTVVVLNDGAGGLGPAIQTHLTFSTHMLDIDSGDVDGDGHADLVSVLENVGLTVQLGLGGGDFATGFNVPVGPHPLDVVTGDLDGDGDDDAVAKHLLEDLTGGPAEVLLGSGGTLIPAATVWVGASAADPWLVDVNGDTLLDLVSFANSQGIRVFAGLGTGLFATAVVTPLAPAAWYVEVGDVDLDGFPDLVVLHDSVGTNTVTVLVGDGNGSFTPQQVLQAESSYGLGGLALGDLDADGFPELLSSGGTLTKVALRFDNDGAGSFSGPSVYALGNYPLDVAVTDLDGDDRPDVLALTTNLGDPGDGGLTLLRNLGPDEPWTWLGQGKAGAAGIPMLVAHGTLQAGEPLTLELRGAAPSSATTLVIGLSPLFASFKGGVLVPQPNLLLSGLVTNAQGGLLLGGDWPDGVPSGTQTWYQFWIADPAVSAGTSASNGVTAAAP